MEVRQLRIGNYIQDKDGGIEQVNELLSIRDIKESVNDEPYEGYYNPIPLTEEWLVKFGFEDTYFADSGNLSFYRMGGLNFLNSDFELVWFGTKVEHVHQLQNLYFALTGEELTVQV